MRYKQIFRCTTCCRRRWREVAAKVFDPAPAIEDLRRAARCVCGCREIEVRQYKLMSRTADQTFPGGMRMALLGFDRCIERDMEQRAAIDDLAVRTGERFIHPHDPEFGWTPALEALLPTLPHNGGTEFLALKPPLPKLRSHPDTA